MTHKVAIENQASAILSQASLAGETFDGSAKPHFARANALLRSEAIFAKELCGSHGNHLTEWGRVILGGRP